MKPNLSPTVGANLAFIEPRPLTGPGYYAVQVFEQLAAMQRAGSLPFALCGYVQDDARYHFSREANSCLSGIGRWPGRFYRVAFEQLKLPLISRRDKIGLLWSPSFVSPLWGAPALVSSVHDMYYEVLSETIEPRQQRYFRTMIPLSARACTALITISENSKNDILKYLKLDENDVYVTPLASRMHKDDHSDQKDTAAIVEGDFVLLVANTTPNKNCDRVMQAIAMLNRRGAPITLVHIGNDIDGNLKRAAIDNNVEDLLVGLGQVSDAVLAEAYRHCTATVVASTYEGFGMPAAEAQAMGAPLICSNRSAVPEAAGGLENGAAIFIDPFNVEAIADAVDLLRRDPDLRSELSRRGLQQARNMSWQRTAEETVAVFAKILSNPKR